MKTLRTTLLTATFVLAIYGIAASFAVSFCFALLLIPAAACGAADYWLAKYDLDQDKDLLVDKFFSYDVHAQNLLLKAVESKRRVFVCDESDHPVTLDGFLRFDDVQPIEVRKIARQGLLAKVGEIEEKYENKNGFVFVCTERFKINNNTLYVKHYVKKRGLINKYGLMKEEERED
ncbi:MAG: hypothetical protein IJM54_09965 [Thermoguttaceae bacterium]|nr:hypothetical protein [Thermoguttaceae bacterium]